MVIPPEEAALPGEEAHQPGPRVPEEGGGRPGDRGEQGDLVALAEHGHPVEGGQQGEGDGLGRAAAFLLSTPGSP